jgi:Ala-tRNA(Pro) deacylase
VLLEDYRVADVMRVHVPTVAPDRPLVEALELLAAGGEGFLIAVDRDAHPLGILTDGDVLRLTLAERQPLAADLRRRPPLSLRSLADTARLRHTLDLRVQDWMTAPVATVEAGDSIERVVDVLTAHSCKQLAAVRDGALVGVVRRIDLVGPIARVHRDVAANEDAVGRGGEPDPRRESKGADPMTYKEDLEAYLREQEVAFALQHHPVAYTAQEVAAAEHVPGDTLAKVVMVMADDRLVMLTVPATHRVNLRKVAELVGAEEARLAEETEFAAVFPGCEPGAMAPFRRQDVALYLDESLASAKTIAFQAGTHTDTISMTFADYAKLAEPEVAEFSYHA